MHVPAVFKQDDLPTLLDFIESHSFGILCSTDEDGVPFATHLPLLLERGEAGSGKLRGHVALANPQWRHAEGKPVLAIFSGPHHYISPAWYRAERVVPTWNYAVVHVTGTFRALHDQDALLKLLLDTVRVYESPRAEPWRPESEEYLRALAPGVVGFEIDCARIEGKWKLGQNHPPERRARVLEALRALGGEDAEEVARLMEETLTGPWRGPML
jgi:transcriptional regulator